jgi:hypothetical protein
VAHSATTAAVPTVSPSCPVVMASPLTAAWTSRTAVGAGASAQAAGAVAPVWP